MYPLIEFKINQSTIEMDECITHLNYLKISLKQIEEGRKYKNSKKKNVTRINNEINYTEQRIVFLENEITELKQKLERKKEIDHEKKYLELLQERVYAERLLGLEFAKKNMKKFDVFISHASPDKKEFVRPLATELKKLGVKVWYDEFELKLGDSLREQVDLGLKNSKFGLLILSNSFFNRPWTNYELNGFISREMNESKVILPIWHKVSKDEVIAFSPTLADKVAIKSSDYEISEIANSIFKVL